MVFDDYLGQLIDSQHASIEAILKEAELKGYRYIAVFSDIQPQITENGIELATTIKPMPINSLDEVPEGKCTVYALYTINSYLKIKEIKDLVKHVRYKVDDAREHGGLYWSNEELDKLINSIEFLLSEYIRLREGVEHAIYREIEDIEDEDE